MSGEEENIRQVAGCFRLNGEMDCWRPFGSGHINKTYRIEYREDESSQAYILQKINAEVFREPEKLMRNILQVTEFLRNKISMAGGDPRRETLRLIPAADGKWWHVDGQGDYWRMFEFIAGSESFDQVRSPEDFYQSARAFGHFQCLLADYPVETLEETIPDFHHTPKRFEALRKAAEEDVCGRAGNVRREIRFFQEREEEMKAAMEQYQAGRLPLRVTHNDTKLNNILFDRETGEALCIVDLDTVMPGFSIFDFGDSIRFGANTALEDEKDLNKVSLSLELFESYTKGFLEGCGGSLTETEKRMLPAGAKLMTMECGMRFLTDYLQGDTYFHIDRPKQNLDRARCQIALAEDMERKWEKMKNIVENAGK